MISRSLLISSSAYWKFVLICNANSKQITICENRMFLILVWWWWLFGGGGGLVVVAVVMAASVMVVFLLQFVGYHLLLEFFVEVLMSIWCILPCYVHINESASVICS